MADYSSFLYNAISGAGDAFVQNRQDAFAKKKYSDALMADQAATAYAHQRDAVKDSQWQQGYNLDQQRLAQSATPEVVKEFLFAKRDGFKGGLQDWITLKSASGGQGNFALDPIYLRDPATGKITIGQLGKGGAINRPDLGGLEAVNPFDKAAMSAEGKATGAAAAALPNNLRSADRLNKGVDDLLNDPGLPLITGPIQGRMTNFSGDANRAQSRLDLIRGGGFLQAYNDLRGAGAITEKEGQAAQAAYNRLNTQTMGDNDFRQALMDFQEEVGKLVELAKQRASAGGYQAPSGGAPVAPPAGGGWSVQQVP